MTMQRWGRECVTNAFEVYLILTHPPRPRGLYAAWEELLAIEPPTWGGRDAAVEAARLQQHGWRVWTWDQFAVVFSRADTVPPRGVLYRSWRSLAPTSAP